MTELDHYLAGLSIEERAETLDQWRAEDEADARAEGARDDWQTGQIRWERQYFGR